MESELYQSQSQATPEGKVNPQLRPVQVSRGGNPECDSPKPQDRVRDELSSTSEKTEQIESNTAQTPLDSTSSSEYGGIPSQYSSLVKTRQLEGPCPAEMKLDKNFGDNASSKPYKSYDDGVAIDETCIVQSMSCDKPRSETVLDPVSIPKEVNSQGNISSTAETHYQNLATETQHHANPPNTSSATGSQETISTAVAMPHQILLNTTSTTGKECHLISTTTATTTRLHHPPTNTSLAAGKQDHQNVSTDIASKDLQQCDNSNDSPATDSFPKIKQTVNDLQTVTELEETETFQLPPLPEINSTITSTDALHDIQHPFVSLVKLDEKMLSDSNKETLNKKANSSQYSPKSNKSLSRTKSNPAHKHFSAIQKENSWNTGYQQILDMCDRHFPPKITLIQDLINLSHKISDESGIKENFTNICNQLMSEILHLNLTLTNICKSAINSGKVSKSGDTSQRELVDTESLSKESLLSQSFDSLLSVWKQNMKQRESTGKLSFEDAELNNLDERAVILIRDTDSPTQISVGDIERQWHARFPSKGSNCRNTTKSKPRSRKSTEPVWIEKDDNEDDDYVPSKSKRSKQKQVEVKSEQDFGRSLRTRKNKLKTYSEEFYHDGESLDSGSDGDNLISDTEHPLDKSDEEYIPTDEEDTSAKIECSACNMTFKTQDLLWKHNNVKHNKQMHTCNICNQSFRIKIALDSHLRKHAKPEAFIAKKAELVTGEYECKECGVKFLQKFRLAIHMRIHTDNKYKCEVCNQGFNQQKALNKHLADTHLVHKQLDCEQCGRTFRSATSLRFHMMNHNGILPFACKICDKKFTNQSTCNSHERTHTNAKSFPCEECDKGFGTRAALKRHKLLHGQEKNFQCDLCGQQFRQKSTLVSHRRTHTGEKPYVCDICGKAFTQSSILNMHKRVHTGYKPHKCTECESSFSCRASLRKHMTIHTGEKNFMCKVCGRRFARAQGLKYHEISHTGVKPYQCKECGKRFTCRKHVKRHQLLHSGEMPYSCSVCGKLFRQEQNMKVHMRIHSGDKPFQCTNCGRCFAYKQSLQQHNMRCVESVIYLPLQQQASASMNPSTQ